MAKILLRFQDNIATITINNPDKLNCLDMDMLAEIEHSLVKIKGRENAGALIIKGAGDKAFSTGGNLRIFEKLKKFHETKEWIRYGNEVFNLLEAMPIATIAQIKGYVMGGGLELALACDLRFASEDAVFAMPELNHGWVPGWGGMTRLRRLLGEAKAKEIILLGERISCDEAARIGLVNKVLTDDELAPVSSSTARKLAAIDPFLLEMTKKAIMDQHRSTSGNDLLYDALATYYSKI